MLLQGLLTQSIGNCELIIIFVGRNGLKFLFINPGGQSVSIMLLCQPSSCIYLHLFVRPTSVRPTHGPWSTTPSFMAQPMVRLLYIFSLHRQAEKAGKERFLKSTVFFLMMTPDRH